MMAVLLISGILLQPAAAQQIPVLEEQQRRIDEAGQFVRDNEGPVVLLLGPGCFPLEAPVQLRTGRHDGVYIRGAAYHLVPGAAYGSARQLFRRRSIYRNGQRWYGLRH